MKIVIVGGGAIGRLFGSFLAKGGNEISLIDVDQEVVGAMQSGGIGVMAHGEDDPDAVTLVPVTAMSDGTEITTCDLVLLMVKSFSTGWRPRESLISYRRPVRYSSFRPVSVMLKSFAILYR